MSYQVCQVKCVLFNKIKILGDYVSPHYSMIYLFHTVMKEDLSEHYDLFLIHTVHYTMHACYVVFSEFGGKYRLKVCAFCDLNAYSMDLLLKWVTWLAYADNFV